jgi:hypothetical protein
MATYTVRSSKHATLVAGTVDTVKLTTKPRAVEVRNLSATALIYFTVDGSAPTVGGDDTYRLSANETLQVDIGNAVELPRFS